MKEEVLRAMRQYRGWIVVDVESGRAADGQYILRIQSPDGKQETLVTSDTAIFGLDEDEEDEQDPNPGSEDA